MEVKARLKDVLMEEVAVQLESIEQCQSVHKGVADMSLREWGLFPDKKGYESITLLLQATQAVRDLDLAAAETHVRGWKKSAQERMDNQLFDESAHCSLCVLTGERTMGTDESTRQLGEWIKGWSDRLDLWLETQD